MTAATASTRTRTVTRAALEARLAACEDALNAVSAALSSPYVRVEHELLGEVTPELSRAIARYWDAVTDPRSAECDLCGALTAPGDLSLIGNPRTPAVACAGCAAAPGWPEVPGDFEEVA